MVLSTGRELMEPPLDLIQLTGARLFRQLRQLGACFSKDQLAGILARGTAGSFAVQMATILVAMLVNIFLARVMGAAQYGLYSLAISWLALPTMISRCGFDTVAVKSVSAYECLHQWGPLRGLLRGCWLLVLLTSALVTALAFGSLWVGSSRISPELRLILAIAFSGIFLGALCQVAQSCLTGLRKPALALLPEPLLRSLALMALVALWFFTRGTVSGSAAISLHILSLAVALIAAWIFLYRALPPPIFQEPREYRLREWLRLAFPALVISMSMTFLNQTGTLMVGMYLSPKDVGLFAAAARLSTLVVLVLTASNFIAMPTISALYARKEMESLQRLAVFYCRAMLILATPIFLFLVLGGQWLLALSGSEFTAAHGTLTILAAGQLINAFTGPVGFFLTMTGHQNVVAWVMFAMTVVTIGAHLLLIPWKGINGAATATAMTIVLSNVWLVWMVRKQIGVRISII
jgi:O-antigen/teichoic acid export membrane protein